MRASSSSPPQMPATTTVKSPEAATRPQPDSPSQSAPPTPPEPSSHHHNSTSMPTIQSKVQPNPPSQNETATCISINSLASCLILSEPAATSQHDPPVGIPSRPSDCGMVGPVSLSTISRQSITPSFSFPGASSSATTTYDCNFLDSADSHCTLTNASSTESISVTTSQQTPNVYINGLPPHSSEQDLFALARPFGDIQSVRTFTRHVSEKPTGYGFVLFNDVESAQRCIEGLRKYRNLHPSFSKQVHRIPGTEYARQNAVQSTDQDESSFKSRMEKLRDATSTNLYIEGLPLSIDEESLAALMLPHKIKSSRFFKTKLSNPPRIIAFVRLETRVAAEETIERLHGRMVRGWNDPGCRISVRFADSAEQRELRRAERVLKNGDQSPSRITIAQAALLNLRGQDLQANTRDVAGCKPQRSVSSRPGKQAAFNPARDTGLPPTSRSLPSNLCCTYREPPLLATSDLLGTTEMDTLLQSIQNGYGDGPSDSISSLVLDEYLMTQQSQLRALASATLLARNPSPVTLPRGHAQAHNGFTPAEELILEAHAQRLKLQARFPQSPPLFEPISSSRRLNANVRSFDSVPHEPLQASEPTSKGMLYQDILPTISENNFHTMGQPARSLVATTPNIQGLVDGCPPNISAMASTIFVRPPSRAVSIVPPPPDYEEPGKQLKSHHHGAERSIRPKQISPSFNHRQSIAPGESKSHCSLQELTRPNTINSGNSNTNNSKTISRDKNNELQHTYMYSHTGVRSCPEEDKGSRFRSLPISHIHTKKSPKPGEQHSTAKEGLKSPSTVSPALTYSSRTPSTLSPATPFFGSFTGNQDAFEVMTMENEDMTERKLKGRV